MNLGQYIHELLLENETVIIPGFGAFVSNYKPAVINEETQEIIPPSKEILFNQKIRNNDGLLVGYIADLLFVSHFDALKKIEKERESIIYQLDKGEKVILEETGILFLNEKQEIQFESFIEDNLLLDSFGLEAISLHEEETPEQEKIMDSEEEIQEELKTESHEIAPEPIIIPEPEVDQIKEPKAESVTEEPENEPEKIVSEQNVIIEPEEEQIKIPEPDKIPEPVLVEEKKEKKKLGWLWSILVIIPLIIAGIFVGKNEFFSKTPETIIPEIQSETPPLKTENIESIPDSIQLNVPDSVNQTEPAGISVQKILDENNRFFLVGGSFKEEENAQKFIDQFEIEGYEPFQMGKIGNFYFVGFGSFETEAEAVVAKRSFLDKNPESGIWVYEKNQE